MDVVTDVLPELVAPVSLSGDVVDPVIGNGETLWIEKPRLYGSGWVS